MLLMAQATIPNWELHHRLARAREFVDMKQDELADAIGVSRRSIVNYETGRTAPRRPVLLSWAMACGVSLEWLLTGQVGPDSQGNSPFRWEELASAATAPPANQAA